MSNFKEVEFKYNAKDIPRSLFDEAVRSLDSNIKKELCLFASSENGKDSVDHYFSTDDDRFMRWREGQDKNGVKTWELTSKVKLNDSNNNIRDEVNITLNARDMTIGKAKEFSDHHNCKYDFSIKKDVQIYWVDNIVLSHYTVFDIYGKELNVFMEIEADESYAWDSTEQAVDVISEWEKKLAPLGITYQHRIKKSLYEFYTGKTSITYENLLETRNTSND